MFRKKAQQLGLFQNPIAFSAQPEQQADQQQQQQVQVPQEQVPRQLPQQPVQQLSLLERRQLRQRQLGLQVPLMVAEPQQPSPKIPESRQPVVMAPPPVVVPVAAPVDLSVIYKVDKTKTLGEESQFKVAYKATRKSDNKNYVLFVFKEMNGGEDGVAPDNKEIKIFEKLIRDNRCETHAICPVQVGIYEGAIAIVTEFIEGITLAKLIEILKERDQQEFEKNKLTISLVGDYKLGYIYALQLFEKIIRSLQFIHNTWKFVHLDIKPDNIMISNDLQSVYIIDLGSGCFSPEIVKDNCVDRFAAEIFVAPESTLPLEEGYWDFKETNTPEQNRAQFENWKKADVFSIGKVFDYFLTQNIVSIGCKEQKDQLLSLIKRMIDDDYTKRPDSSQVLLEIMNLKAIQCAGGISQLARCFL